MSAAKTHDGRRDTHTFFSFDPPAKGKKADLLVLGTRGRSRHAKALLKRVTEEALRALDVDILAAPAAK